jgi:hypothetical protein
MDIVHGRDSGQRRHSEHKVINRGLLTRINTRGGAAMKRRSVSHFITNVYGYTAHRGRRRTITVESENGGSATAMPSTAHSSFSYM